MTTAAPVRMLRVSEAGCASLQSLLGLRLSLSAFGMCMRFGTSAFTARDIVAHGLNANNRDVRCFISSRPLLRGAFARFVVPTLRILPRRCPGFMRDKGYWGADSNEWIPARGTRISFSLRYPRLARVVVQSETASFLADDYSGETIDLFIDRRVELHLDDGGGLAIEAGEDLDEGLFATRLDARPLDRRLESLHPRLTFQAPEGALH